MTLRRDFNLSLSDWQLAAAALYIVARGPGFGEPHFRLSMDNDKVVTVQRVFVDGAGCELIGPLFTSKEAALQFSIDGLSKYTNLTKKESLKLATAKKLLAELTSIRK